MYYSRSGNTKKVAETLKDYIKADLEEVIDEKNRKGVIGWIMAGKDAGEKSLTKIREPKKDPGEYELVIIGSPIWNDTVSTPIRTYITMNKDKLDKYALFFTQKSQETSGLTDVKEILGRSPVTTLNLIEKTDIKTGVYPEKVEEFAVKLEEFMSKQ
jgi:flavodoxin